MIDHNIFENSLTVIDANIFGKIVEHYSSRRFLN